MLVCWYFCLYRFVRILLIFSDCAQDTLSLTATPHQLGFQMDAELSSLSITKTLETLDHLLNDDDSDIFSKVESFKNLVKQKQKAKEISEKSKSDVSDNSFRENTKQIIENGILLNDCDRKKISLRLKSTSTLKQPPKEVDDLEQQEQNQSARDKESSKFDRFRLSIRGTNFNVSNQLNQVRKKVEALVLVNQEEVKSGRLEGAKKGDPDVAKIECPSGVGIKDLGEVRRGYREKVWNEKPTGVMRNVQNVVKKNGQNVVMRKVQSVVKKGDSGVLIG